MFRRASSYGEVAWSDGVECRSPECAAYPPSPPSPARGEGARRPYLPHCSSRCQLSQSQLPHHGAAEAVDGAFSRECNKPHVAGLARLEAHRGAGGDIEPHAARLLAFELQRRIGFEEMIVRADLDRTVAGVGDRQRHGLAAGIELDLTVLDEEFTGDHD